MLTIKTNNVPRPVLRGYELSPKELTEFTDENTTDDELEELSLAEFCRYKGEVYLLSEFISTRPGSFNLGLPEEFKKWDGYSSDSFFSGQLIRFCDNYESVIVGRYCS